ncbi:MAG: hypothetical protein QF805_25395, partial [Pirellulaceae bacterium]|nr:hypothetical protein [Pirellulaceae bacterium]
MGKLLRVGLTLAATTAAYWAYALLAVPWIEPEPIRVGPVTDIVTEIVAPRINIRPLFAADAW